MRKRFRTCAVARIPGYSQSLFIPETCGGLCQLAETLRDAFGLSHMTSRKPPPKDPSFFIQ